MRGSVGLLRNAQTLRLPRFEAATHGHQPSCAGSGSAIVETEKPTNRMTISMSLEQAIQEIRVGIRAGRYTNEASVSQGIVMRILNCLGWPTYDTQVICPEYSLQGRRVDFGLCHPAGKPIAFIEVKQIGQSDGAERQLFEYAFVVGAPLAILTDGQEWNFFLPAGQGDYGDRRVYKLDIVSRELGECVSRLTRYLGYKEISTGKAIEAASADYNNVARERQMIAAMPLAWSKLVTEEDDLLLEIVADKVETLCGFKPDLDAVATFLREISTTPIALPLSLADRPTKPSSSVRTPNLAAIPLPYCSTSASPVGFTLNGTFVPSKNARDVLVSVVKKLASRDAGFLKRFASLPKHGRTRRYVARSPAELYPGRSDLASEFTAELGTGWYLGVNVSRAQIQRIVEMSCDVAGLKLGRDLLINLGGVAS